MKHFSKILLLIFTFSMLAFSQYGKISGKVTDRESKEPLVGASVQIQGTALGSATDVNGNYVILNVPAGTYTLIATYIGYQQTTVTGVNVVGGLTREINIPLASTAVEVGTVTVIAQRPLIEKSATNVTRVQSTQEMDKLPVRGVQAYFTLQPGVVLQNGTVYIRGSRTEEVGYTVEGANARDVVNSTLRNNNNSVLITTIPEALEEVSVQAGGFGAEYGGSNAGIVSQTFKTAGSQMKVTVQAETDNFGNFPGEKVLGAYSYGYSDYVLTVGMPLTEKIKLFAAGEQNFIRDRNQWFWSGADFGYLKDNGLEGGTVGDSALVKWNAGNVPGRMNNRYTGNGTLLFDYQPLQVRLAGAFTWSRNSNNDLLRDMFALERLPVGDNSNLLLNGKVSYFLSEKSFVEANINYLDQRNKTYDPNFGDNLIQYNDSVAAAKNGWQYQTLIVAPVNYNFNGFSFRRPGFPLIPLYSKDKNGYIGGSVGLVSRAENHEIKVGGSFEYWSVSHYDIDPTTIYSNVLNNPDRARDKNEYSKSLRLNSQVNNYGYDEFGNPVASGLDGPKNPYFAAAYINDRIEMTDLIVNAGLRVDALYLDGWSFSNPSELGYDATNFTLNSVKKGNVFTYLEPRIGFSFPASERTVFHLQYGKYVQAPPLYALYRSRASAVYIFQGGRYFTNPVGFNIEPVRTTQYEIGISQQFSEVAAFDVTGFFKNITGQLQNAYYPQSATSPIRSYVAYANGDFTTSMGLEFSLRIRRIQRLQAVVNYTLQDARGTNSFASSAAAILSVSGGEVVPSMTVPLDYAQTHRGSMSLDYRWASGDGGPILERLGMNLLFTFNSGHPYTLATGSGGQQGPDLGAILNDADARTRFPVEPVNNSTTPWNYNLDLRVDKTVSIANIDFNLYVYVQNLLNTKNVTNVYYRTGNAYDDGWLSDPNASGNTLANPDYGETYRGLYQAINLENNQNQRRTNGFVNFGAPRQVRAGVRIEL